MARVGANLTLNTDGRYWVTYLPIIKETIKGTNRAGLYITPGEPLLSFTVCAEGVSMFVSADELAQLSPGQSIPIWIDVEKRDEIYD